MYTDDDLAAAVQAGILSKDTAAAFRDYIARVRDVHVADEEQFRLVTGFNDIFVVIACILLLVSVEWIGSWFDPVIGAGAFAAASWILAEFFVRTRRMALPAIVLLLAFTGSILAASLLCFKAADHVSTAGFIISAVITSVATWLHWRRFKVPITVAAGVTAVIVCAVGLLKMSYPVISMQWLSLVLLIAGLLTFTIAMNWDSSDTLRRTRKSDVAFWLHLVAAPLIVHPIFTTLGIFQGNNTLLQSSVVLIVYLLMAIISISIDRRALMVSSLAYVLFTFSALLNTYGLVSLHFAVTGLIIGSALLLLSAYWHKSRAALVGHFPKAVQAWLPPLR